MNLTIFSLMSSNLLCKSPIFMKQHISLIDCHYTKFFPLLFYNQKRLHLQKCSFSKGLGSIIFIKKDNPYDSEIIEEVNNITYITYKDMTFNSTIHFDMPGNMVSITILNCVFHDIISLDYYRIILIQSDKISFYITDTTFIECTSSEDIISLPRCRYPTITHTCCINCKSVTNRLFLYFDSAGDFIRFLYSTIYNCSSLSSGDPITNVLIKNGDQYLKCLNISNLKYAKAIQFESALCFSFSMSTIANCTGGYIYVSNPQTDKVIEMVNIYNDYQLSANHDSLIKISSYQYSSTLIMMNCVLLNHPDRYIFDPSDMGSTNIMLIDCILTSYNGEDIITIQNCSLETFAYYNLNPYPYLTNEYCIGGINDFTFSAYGCNIGICPDFECSITIGFLNAAPYTTIFHSDIMTPMISPSNVFSNSKLFSETNNFSKSLDFTKSSKFSKSNEFSVSSEFSKTSEFTKSFEFSNSLKFSKTSEFLKTPIFSESFQFSNSFDFSKSPIFSTSHDFTESVKFQKTSFFSKSSQFSNSLTFSKTLYFSSSFVFTRSFQFTDSSNFLSSSFFSYSFVFSKSSDFSNSITFTPKQTLTSSDFFTKSNKFSFSLPFSESIEFSISEFFSKSNSFSLTKTFIPTNAFTKSNEFTLSSYFTQSNVFSNSAFFDPTPTQSVFGQKIETMMSFSQSLTHVKSVSLSMSLSLSKTIVMSYIDEIGDFSEIFIETEFYFRFPYIIHFYSLTMIQTIFSFEVIQNKVRFTSEQLIGIVCGTVAAFFQF